MKKLLVLFWGLYLAGGVNAAVVDTARARIVAENFLKEKLSLQKGEMTEGVRLRLFREAKSADTVFYYVFNRVGGEGFVLVAADDRLLPVLAYSPGSSFKSGTEMPEALKEWLTTTQRQIRYVLRKDLRVTAAKKELWKKYLVPPVKGVAAIQEVAPLLTTKWNQGKFYNELCPEDPQGTDGHTWAGCVAVAMAQVMKYWNYPEYGSGENSYYISTYGTQSADFASMHYDWIAMPASLTDYNTPVATLMYHCGVSVNMRYSVSRSSASSYSVARALKNYFDYSKETVLVDKWRFTEHAWDSLVRSQLNLGQPLIYFGGIHAFNLDGYQDTSYFHVNWGWGGAYDGYYYLDDLTPGSNDFNSDQRAVINIRPDCGEAPSGPDTLTDVTGTAWDNGGWGSNYYNCSDTRTLLMPEDAARIRLRFDRFRTVAGQDTLYLYDGDNLQAPLLAALSGDTLPGSIVSTRGKVLLHFVSNEYSTDEGYELTYTCAEEDAGVTGFLSPPVRTCGGEDDSIMVVVRNFGIQTLSQLQVRVEVQTPRGHEIYTAMVEGELHPDEQDTLLITPFNTKDPGDYLFTCYPLLDGDTLITGNDTLRREVEIKVPQPVPFYENVDRLNYEMGDWTSVGAWVWFKQDRVPEEEGNTFFSCGVYPGHDQFFYWDRLITGVTEHTGLWFDYRILNNRIWPPVPEELKEGDTVYVLVSGGCGDPFDTVYTISTANHQTDSMFQRVFVPLKKYAGRKIRIGFATHWASLSSEIHYDNILVADSIRNDISGTSVCEGARLLLHGTEAEGGVGPLTYAWEESDDSLTWRAAAHSTNTPDYSAASFSTPLFFRRIVRDTLWFADTSKVVYVDVIPWPVPTVSADTAVCAGMPVTLTAAGGDTYRWTTGETTPVITVTPKEDTTYTVIITNGRQCATDTSVKITVHPLPRVTFGEDTSICRGGHILLDPGNYVSCLWNTGDTTPVLEVSPDHDMEYSVTVTDDHGCSGEGSVTVVVHPLPAVVLGPDTTACAGSSVTLDAGDFESFSWNTGASGRTLTVDTSGTYWVTVTDVHGCENSDTVRVQFETCTGMTGTDRVTVKIYPNPSAGIFYLEGLPATGAGRIKVMNMLGEVVKTIVPEKELVRLDLQDQPVGLYFIRIEKDETSQVFRLMIQR